MQKLMFSYAILMHKCWRREGILHDALTLNAHFIAESWSRRRARERSLQADISLNFIQADAEALPFADECAPASASDATAPCASADSAVRNPAAPRPVQVRGRHHHRLWSPQRDQDRGGSPGGPPRPAQVTHRTRPSYRTPAATGGGGSSARPRFRRCGRRASARSAPSMR